MHIINTQHRIHFVRKRLPIFALLLMIGVLVITGTPLYAADLALNVGDEAALNAAIAQVNAEGAGTHTINLTANINLTADTTPLNNITATQIIINGNGFTVNGQNISTLRPFFIETDTTVEINDLTISGGNTTNGAGGGIYNEGALTLSNSIISGNSSNSYGGGIYSDNATLTLIDSTVSGNTSGGDGGGINSYNTTLTLINSTISNNTSDNNGGGIRSINAEIMLTNSTVSGNVANSGGGIDNSSLLTLNNSSIFGNSSTYNGGGINISGGNTVTLTDSNVSNNSASDGGGINNSGDSTLTLIGSTIADNSASDGGGINNSSGSTVILTDSTISGNATTGAFSSGGGINNSGSSIVTLVSSTISENSAVLRGGGIHNFSSTVTLTNSTVSGNLVMGETSEGGGLSNFSGTVTLTNSLVANQDSGLDCDGDFISNGYNLDSDGSCELNGAGDISNGTAELLPLAVNEPGNTATHALGLYSDARNAIPMVNGSCNDSGVVTDQRGVARPQFGQCDMGAFEVDEMVITVADEATVVVDEGNTAVNSGTISDATNIIALTASAGNAINHNDGTWSWSYNSGDGSADSQTVIITARVSGIIVSETTFDLVVNNVAPTIDLITAPIDPVEIDSSVTISIGFSDPADVADAPFACTFDYDNDGTVDETVTDVTDTACGGTHIYTETGVYTVAVTVADKDGGIAAAEHQYVVVFDPYGGYVTGSGSINSPAGAYYPDPTITGQAVFGFFSEYRRGAAIPTGQTEFRFHVASLLFQSADYEWLVVQGHKAIFKGTGTLNGGGNYGFFISAVDAELETNTSEDLFRIRIWDKDNGGVVIYDNQIVCSNRSEDADPCTTIAGGSISIHASRAR